jgi:hypothetical protein
MKKAWPLLLKCGLISIGFGIALLLAYITILPHLKDGISERLLFFMTVTGHALFIFVGFSYPGLQICGQNSPACVTAVDWIAMLTVCAILLIYYFGIGALIGFLIEKYQARKK